MQSDGSIAWGAAGELAVNEEVELVQSSPVVTELSDGRVLFTWQSNDPNVDGDNFGIAARVGTVQSDGSVVWDPAGELVVNEENQGSQFAPQVTVLSDGRVLFSWDSSDPQVDGDSQGVATRIGTVQSDGSIAWDPSGEFRVNAEVQGFQVSPQITQLSDGRVLFTWRSDDPDVDGDDSGISAHVLDLGIAVEDQPLEIDIAATLADTDGSETLGFTLSGFPDGATFSLGAFDAGSGNWIVDDPADIAALGSAPLTMTPPQDYNGVFDLTVTANVTDSATDSTGGTVTDTTSVSETVSITIAPVNDAPVANPDTNGADAVVEAGVNPGNTPFPGDPDAAGNVLTNDTDVDPNETKTVVGVAAGNTGIAASGNVGVAIAGTYGTLTLQSDGVWTYALDNLDADTNSLAQDETGQDVFTYTMQDSGGAQSTTTLTVNVTGSNEMPEALALSNDTIGDGVAGLVVGSLSANDPDGDALTYSIQPGLNGDLFGINGSLLKVGGSPLSPGTFQVTVRATDRNGAFADETFTVNVEDRALFRLTAGADPIAMPPEGGTVTGTPSTLNAGDSLTGGAGHDVLVLSGPGDVRLDELAAFSGFEEVQWGWFGNVFLRDGVDVSIFASGGGSKTYFLGTGSEIIRGGTFVSDDFVVHAPNDLNSGDILDGGVGGGDLLLFNNSTSVHTYDLRVASLLNIEEISFDAAGGSTLLIDQASLSGVTRITGKNNNQLITEEDTLDLGGIEVVGVKVASSNPAGTTFTVDRVDTALQVVGGPGNDTLDASTISLTADQRALIFASDGIETVIDDSGTYSTPFAGATFLTSGDDMVVLGDGGGQVVGAPATLNSGDSLIGGAGVDVLALVGPSIFDLNNLTAFSEFEELHLINAGSVTLPDNVDLDVVSSGTGTGFNLGDDATVSITANGDSNGFRGGDNGTLTATANGIFIGFEGGNNGTVDITVNGSIRRFIAGDNATSTVTVNSESAFFGEFQLGSGQDNITVNGPMQSLFRVFDVVQLTDTDSLSAGEHDSDELELRFGSETTFDLRRQNLENIEVLNFDSRDGTLLVDQSSLDGFARISGRETAQLVTGETSLDLTGIEIADVKVTTSNATGTTFIVNRADTALQIVGGAGNDTIDASAISLTASQRDVIFASGIETIIDENDTYTTPFTGSTVLTTGNDIVVLGDSGEQVVGTSSTLKDADSLSGGAGNDVLALFGPGIFNLGGLATFEGFEEVQLYNESDSAALFLRDGVDIAVTSSGSGTKSYFLGTGNDVITGGSGLDVFSASPAELTVGDSLDGGAGTADLLNLYGSGVHDLRGIDLSNIEQIDLNGSNRTVLIDQASLTGVTTIFGNASNQFVTAEPELNLIGLQVSGVKIASSNATGTTFTVDNASTALQIVGGPGNDTLDASTISLTADQRTQIFASGGVDTIIDDSGIYAGNSGGTLVGTDGPDNLFGGNGADRLEGGEGDDVMVGGPDGDTFVFAADFGEDTIVDFTPDEDIIELENGLFADEAELLAAIDVSTGDTVVELDMDNIITVLNVELDQDDFNLA